MEGGRFLRHVHTATGRTMNLGIYSYQLLDFGITLYGTVGIEGCATWKSECRKP